MDTIPHEFSQLSITGGVKESYGCGIGIIGGRIGGYVIEGGADLVVRNGSLNCAYYLPLLLRVIRTVIHDIVVSS